MTLTERSVDGVTILDLSGNLTLGDSSQRLGDKVRSLLQQGQKSLVLNLAQVGYVDSGGLGELVAAYTTATRQGGALKLIGATRKISDLLVITKLATVFESFDSESVAVSSFRAA